MKILVSGFEPFGGESLNPTALLVAEAQSDPQRFLHNGELRACWLPVTLEGSFAKLEREIRGFDPDVILSLGLAGGRSDNVEIERVAINCLDFEIPDNSGQQPREQAIAHGGPAALFTTLPTREMLAALRVKGIPAKISNSAGTYVCNSLFYRLQELCARSRRRSGFVHLPYLPEQAAQRSAKTQLPTPSMPLTMMSAALATMLGVLSHRPQAG